MKIRQELQTKARNEGLAYRKVLTLFAMERFLYRLSKSGVADRFFSERRDAAAGNGCHTRAHNPGYRFAGSDKPDAGKYQKGFQEHTRD